jgi:hypothetical protein
LQNYFLYKISPDELETEESSTSGGSSAFAAGVKLTAESREEGKAESEVQKKIKIKIPKEYANNDFNIQVTML